MKKNKTDKNEVVNTAKPPKKKPVQTEDEMNSIQEFIELKKLQNRILIKMLEKNIPSKNKNK